MRGLGVPFPVYYPIYATDARFRQPDTRNGGPETSKKNGAWGQHAPNRGGHVETKVWELQAAKRLRSSQIRLRPFPAPDNCCKCGPQTAFRSDENFFVNAKKSSQNPGPSIVLALIASQKVLPQSRLKRTVLHYREEKNI